MSLSTHSIQEREASAIMASQASLQAQAKHLLEMAERLAERIERAGLRATAIKSETLAGDVTPAGLQCRRAALGLSQQDVARLAHISRGLLSDLESGRRSNTNTLLHVGRTLAAQERRR